MSVRFNAPPGWPVPSASWAPGDDWMPDPSWPAPPRGWTFWTVTDQRDGQRADLALLEAAGIDAHRVEPGRVETPRFGTAPRTTVRTYGTDRGTWLASLRSRAAAESRALSESRASSEGRAAADASWELDGLVTSAGRLDL